MEKEFNLSEKIVPNFEESKWNNEGEPIEHINRPSVHVTDIKEFIKRLKEAFDNVEVYKTPHIRHIINHFAGEKLCPKQ